MATTVSYSASMRTRKTSSASNAKSSAASQEYYENTYNYVGIVHFAGMALSGKVITGISLRVVAAQAGYGTGHTKTVYVRKANYTCTFQLTVPASVVPSISNVAFSEATSGIADRFGGYVRTRSKLSVSITATGAQGSSISAYRTSIDSVTYSGSSFTTNTLNTAGNLTMTVTVTDSRGRTASATRTVTVLDYSPPSLSQFTAERCNADGTAAQTDGTKVRISAKASGSSVGGKNTLACTVYYKLSSAESWVSAVTLTPSDYAISETNRLLSPTFDALSSYDIKIRVQDVFYYIEQTVSIGTKQVMMDFYKDGSGIAFGKVAENAGKVEFGWPLLLSEALGVDQGGTGAETASAACTKLGAVKKSGDTMTGNLAISGYLYPSLYLLPTYNSTTNRTVFEGSYVGASSFSSWEDGTGNNRRMLEVRNAAYQASLDFAVLLRTCSGGTWASYRLFHAGMATPIPLANGGTGASSAKAALSNLGIFYSASLPSSGTDGQICLVPV